MGHRVRLTWATKQQQQRDGKGKKKSVGYGKGFRICSKRNRKISLDILIPRIDMI